MNKFILGKKLGMSQIFDEKGDVFPVTLIEAGPVVIIQVKTKEKDGYEAVQVGFDSTKKKINKPLAGHLKKTGKTTKAENFRYLREFRTDIKKFKVGDKIDASSFSEGDKVKVSGISKGKGFQGVVKRHGFAGMPASHGHKHHLRSPGSIGQRFPQRTLKGIRMAGRMGGERVSVKNLKVIKVDKERNILALKGAVPGNKNILLEIRG